MVTLASRTWVPEPEASTPLYRLLRTTLSLIVAFTPAVVPTPCRPLPDSVLLARVISTEPVSDAPHTLFDDMLVLVTVARAEATPRPCPTLPVVEPVTARPLLSSALSVMVPLAPLDSCRPLRRFFTARTLDAVSLEASATWTPSLALPVLVTSARVSWVLA